MASRNNAVASGLDCVDVEDQGREGSETDGRETDEQAALKSGRIQEKV
jgi:hypothetical protein